MLRIPVTGPVGVSNDGTRIWNGDLTETAGSAPRGVEMLAPARHPSPSTTSNSLMAWPKDPCAATERSGPFRVIAVQNPRSVVQSRLEASSSEIWSGKLSLNFTPCIRLDFRLTFGARNAAA